MRAPPFTEDEISRSTFTITLSELEEIVNEARHDAWCKGRDATIKIVKEYIWPGEIKRILALKSPYEEEKCRR